MGITRRRLQLHDDLRRRREPVHNVQLVARLIDGTLIAPGHDVLVQRRRPASATRRQGLPRGTGDHQRRAARPGSAAASARSRRRCSTPRTRPVSTSPSGRTTRSTSATTRRGATRRSNYPDIDLKFVNDTAHWLLLRTFVGSSSLAVNLYGAPIHRRVVEPDVARWSRPAPPPVKKISTRRSTRACPSSTRAASPRGRRACAGWSTTPSGSLLYDNTWYSSYRGEKRSSSSARSRSRAEEPPPKEGPSGPSRAQRADRARQLSALAIASASQAGRASAASCPRRRRRGASTRRRPPRRRARPRSRSGSGRRERRRSARGPSGGRRSGRA